MQSNTVKILQQFNYEPIEAHLLTYMIISYDDRKDIANKNCKEQKLYIIEKVIKGTEETYHNFLKALEECEDDSNHELMLHLKQYQIEEEISPVSQSEMLNMPCGSMTDELVLGEMSFPPQFSLIRSNSRSESQGSIQQPNQHSTKTTLGTKSLNLQRPAMPMNTAPDGQNVLESFSDSWVIVYPQTNITYCKNLTLIMEHICDKVIETLMGTNCAQSTLTQIHNVSVSIKLPKEVYLAADPKTITPVTRAADEQIKQPYNNLMKILPKLQRRNHLRINIDLNPILQRIRYSPNHMTLSDCSINSLIQAVDKLNQPTTNRPCTIL